jgi:hypothetical protein
MNFLSRVRGDDFCPHCGEKIRWIRLITNMWIAVQEQPVLYVPEKGKMWLIDTKWGGTILKDCLIYKRGLGIDLKEIKRGYEPHIYNCIVREKR